jgi:hypothetical protein
VSSLTFLAGSDLAGVMDMEDQPDGQGDECAAMGLDLVALGGKDGACRTGRQRREAPPPLRM